jgi:hypothetical protein
MTVVEQVTKAIENVFMMHGQVNPRCVCDPSEDPGEWAPNAHAIIYHTGNMPSISRLTEWGQVSNELPGMFYVEAINNEVSAVFNLL